MTHPDLLADPIAAQGVIARFLTEPTQRLVALNQLLVSADYAATVAPSAWGVTLYQNMFRLNVGMVEVLVVGIGFIRINCVGRPGAKPFIGPRFEEAVYLSVSAPHCAFVGTLDEFAAIAANLQPYHRKFIDTVGRKKNGEPVAGSRMTKSHSGGLIAYARSFVASPEQGECTKPYWMATDESPVDETFVEGSRMTLQVNAFERNAAARAVCLKHFGTACTICGFDAIHEYGDGVAGLIHVHHIRPLSEIGEAYVVDPIADLRPVCPNCHAVIHSRNPPYSIDNVAALLNKQRSHHPRGDDA